MQLLKAIDRARLRRWPPEGPANRPLCGQSSWLVRAGDDEEEKDDRLERKTKLNGMVAILYYWFC